MCNTRKSRMIQLAATRRVPSVLCAVYRARSGIDPFGTCTDYYVDVNKYPQKSECIMLAQKIQEISGCEDYTPEKVKLYFSAKRYAKGNTKGRVGTKPHGQPVPSGMEFEVAQPSPFSRSAHILYPSIANEPSILSKLDVLLSETPEPTPGIAQIWANRLAVGPADIMTYADLRRAQTQSVKVSMGPGGRHARHHADAGSYL
ncbi:hypothetical protein C8Q79DRAFT_983126 [Trametes meyenii]|nr:hypothetical protein C8Q79DRAFT_983126 [Trametes meyenii]